MKRRNFLLTFLACILMPKLLLANNKDGHDLLVKNGWILKKEDV